MKGDGLDANESNRLFQQADALFKAGRISESLQLLQELNRHYPNTRNILFPLALCLKRLGHVEEALAVCEQLTAHFKDPRADELREKLMHSRTPAGPPPIPGLELDGLDGGELKLNGLDDILGMEPRRPIAPVAVQGSGHDWKKIALIAVGVVALLCIVILPPLLYTSPELPDAPPAAQTAGGGATAVALQGFGIGYLLFSFAFGFVLQCIAVYLVLILFGKLPEDGFGDNIIHISRNVLIFNLWCLIPIVGFFIALYVLVTTYDLGISGCLVFVFISIVLSIIVVLGIVGLGFLFGFGLVQGILQSLPDENAALLMHENTRAFAAMRAAFPIA
ncbi:MAG: tetratricopeptide repeat protein [Candidatus Hydrogenedentes bacterium]|nr:tetratricopeptide repeat protein [Candidatus Hydrogenedentota bacterium]